MSIYLTLWILAFAINALADRYVTYNTHLGPIKGFESTTNVNNIRKTYTVFKKIPYAKPPTGDLRFSNPVPYGSWNETLDATSFGPSCVQPPNPLFDRLIPNKNQSEDCLHLNIYVPSTASSSHKKSVMVWIHGGGYTIGQGMLYDGSYLSVVGDVIVVTVNYRLNVFGFFRLKNGNSPANYGLEDQILATKWVRDNIGSFYGDSRSITIFGESAGGFSVALQAINVRNKGLFQRVILQSGTSNSFSALTQKPYKASESILQALNCSNDSESEGIRCIRNKSSTEILNQFIKFSTNEGTQGTIDIKTVAPFAPALNYSLEANMLDQNNAAIEFYKSLDVMIGTCEGEGSLLLQSIAELHTPLPFNIRDGISYNFFCQHIVTPITNDYFQRNTSIRDAICKKYRRTESLPEQGQAAVDFYGDLFFELPARQSLNVHALNNDKTEQFQYSFNHTGVLSIRTIPWFKDSGHGSELPYLFPTSALLPNPTEYDIFLSTLMVKYWSNFAKTGDVNGPGLPRWPSYSITSPEYIVLDFNITANTDLHSDRMNFWMTEIVPSRPPPSHCTTPECIFG